jgi:hypothetical protein
MSNLGIRRELVVVVLFVASAILWSVSVFPAHAQTASINQLRATITAEVMADPRSKDMTQAQIYAVVNALTIQAENQGLTSSQLTYRPEAPAQPSTTTSLFSCTNISCAFATAFGLDGSVPIIPIALFVVAALFILIYGIMREMGHPHTKV